jgi:ATPase subunit of ABC transporter with duplicated ATPase domains
MVFTTVLLLVRARQAKSKVREQQFHELVSKAKGRALTKQVGFRNSYTRPVSKLYARFPFLHQVELATPEERERQQRLGGVVAEFSGADYHMHLPAGAVEGKDSSAAGEATLLKDFTYSFRQRDHIGIVGPNG